MKDMNSSSLVVAPTRAAGKRWTATRHTARLAAGAAANCKLSGEKSCSASTADTLRILAMDDSHQTAA